MAVVPEIAPPPQLCLFADFRGRKLVACHWEPSRVLRSKCSVKREPVTKMYRIRSYSHLLWRIHCSREIAGNTVLRKGRGQFPRGKQSAPNNRQAAKFALMSASE